MTNVTFGIYRVEAETADETLDDLTGERNSIVKSGAKPMDAVPTLPKMINNQCGDTGFGIVGHSVAKHESPQRNRKPIRITKRLNRDWDCWSPSATGSNLCDRRRVSPYAMLSVSFGDKTGLEVQITKGNQQQLAMSGTICRNGIANRAVFRIGRTKRDDC